MWVEMPAVLPNIASPFGLSSTKKLDGVKYINDKSALCRKHIERTIHHFPNIPSHTLLGLIVMELPKVATLYHTKWCPSSVPLNVIRELEISSDMFQVKTITEEEMKTDEQFGLASPRRMNPVVLLPNGSSLLETGAITLYLLEKFDKDGTLHPLSGDNRRPRFLQGMFYAVTEAFHTLTELYRLTKLEKVRDEDAIGKVMRKIEDILIRHLERELKEGQSDYYLGEQYTAADMLFAYLLLTMEYCEMPFGSDTVKTYYQRLRNKDGFKFAYYDPADCPTQTETS